MFSDLAKVRQNLADRIKADLPDKWVVVDHLESARKSVVPVLYFEYTDISSSAAGQPLGRDQVACGIALTIAAAGDDEDAVDAHVLALTTALQKSDDIYWDTATKIRLDQGSPGWRLPLTVLVDATATATPEE